MKSYTLNYAGSGVCTEFFAPNDKEALELAASMIVGGGHCIDNDGNRSEPVIADQWDADGYNDDDEPCKRILIWACEADAENDNGAKSIAQVETVGAA